MAVKQASKRFKVEVLRKADAATVKELARLIEQLNPDFRPPLKLKDIREVINFPGAKVFVVRDKGKIVATASLIGYPQVEGKIKVWLEDLVVDGAYRGRGIGRQLVKVAQAEAKKLKFRYFVFTSRPSRKTAIKFYSKLGFKSKQTNYYRQEL